MHALKMMLLAIAALIMLVAIAGAVVSLVVHKRGCRRSNGSPRGMLAAIGAAVLVAASLGGCTLISHAAEGLSSPPPTKSTAAAPSISAEVLRVIDGDTIAVRPTAELPATSQYGDEHTVRVLGIDTPEMNKASGTAPDCGAEEATQHLKALLDGHRDVTLVFDPVSDHTDRFGRSLAYVEIPGTPVIDIGLAQVRDGYAEAWYPRSAPAPQRFEAYAAAQRDAEADRAGSHANCSTIGR